MRKLQPNWYLAMQEFYWTVGKIIAAFNVPRAIARHIQYTCPSYDDCMAIVAAHEELISQVGH